jgi:chromate reductase
MARLQIAMIAGSLRRDSINRKLAAALARLAPADAECRLLEIGNLPLYNQDDDDNQAEVVKQFKRDIAAAQGVVFATPEYNRSLPGVLKNAIDHASRPYGQSAWAGKPAGIVGASIGAIGTAIAQQHLRTILAALDVPTLGLPEVFLQVKKDFFDASGDIANADTRKFLQGWMDRYIAWVRKHTS